MAISTRHIMMLALGLGAAVLPACTPPASQSVAPMSYAPMDRHALTGFSLEIADAQSETAEPLSFGMLSSMFSDSTSYHLNKTEPAIRLASAAPMPLPATRSDGAVIMPDRSEPAKVAPRLRPMRGDYFGL